MYDRLTTDDQAPNDGMLDRVVELEENYKKYISPYDKIIEEDVPAFTKFLREKGAMGIIPMFGTTARGRETEEYRC